MADFTIVRSPPVGARSRVDALKFSAIGMNKDHRNVFLRIKPQHKKQQQTMFKAVDGNTLEPVLNDSTKSRRAVSHRYKFTKIFDAHNGQDEVFKESCFTPISNFINGTNCVLFAYGATNAGKTFTIQGTQEKPGIIPRALNLLFNSIKGKVSKEIKFKPEKFNNVQWLTVEQVQKELETKQSILDFSLSKNATVRSAFALSTFSEESLLSISSNNNSSSVCPFFQTMKANLDDECIEIENDTNNVYSVWISYAEIYNENLYDLLQPLSKQKPLTLDDNERKEVCIKGLTEVCVFSPEEAFNVFLFGKHNLHKASTSINHVSSRSHCVFSLKLVKHLDVDCPTFAQISMCTFVDLAGSERAKKTCSIGERVKESQCINTSLHVLGKCMDVLRHNQNTREPLRRMLPCRESKLTRLFQRALEGHEILTMIVNISQDQTLFDETLNVMKFSAIAMELQFDRFDSSTLCSLRKSSFASFLDKHSSCFQSSVENGIDTSDCERYKRLLVYTEELKNNLDDEQKKNTTLEVQIRKEVYTQFCQIMKSLEDSHKQRLEAQRDMFDDYVLLNAVLCQKTLENSHKLNRFDNTDEDDKEDDNNSEELQEKIEFLENKIETLTVLAESGEQLKSAHSALQAKYTKLQLDLASTKTELDLSLKINKCFELKEDNQLVIDELHSQLSTQQSLVKEQNEKIEELKKVIEDARLEYLEHFKEHEDFANIIAEMEKMIADQEMKFEDLTMQLDICNNKLLQHQQKVHEKELEEAELPNKLQLAYEDRDELKFQVSHLKNEMAKLKIENDEKRSLPNASQSCDIMALEALVASHEDKIKKYEEKLRCEEEFNKSLREEISKRKTSLFCSKQDSNEKEISILQKEIKDSVKCKKDIDLKMETMPKENEELKDKLRLAEAAVVAEQKNTKSLRRIWDSEKEKCTEEMNHMHHKLLDMQNNFEELSKEYNNLKALNLELEETVKVKCEEEFNKSLREEISKRKTSLFCSKQDSNEKEISILQKEIKDSVKCKKDIDLKMETMPKENEELKDKLRLAEAAVVAEQKNTKSLRRIWDSEKEKCTEEMNHMHHKLLDMQNNFEELSKEYNNLKALNLELEETVKVKERHVSMRNNRHVEDPLVKMEEELEGFKSRRDAQCVKCESSLKNERTLREREQPEVHPIQNVLRAVIPQNQEQLISDLKEESKSSKDVSRKQRRRRKLKSDEENSVKSVVELPDLPETSVKSDPDDNPEVRQLRPRRKKHLYKY